MRTKIGSANEGASPMSPASELASSSHTLSRQRQQEPRDGHAAPLLKRGCSPRDFVQRSHPLLSREQARSYGEAGWHVHARKAHASRSGRHSDSPNPDAGCITLVFAMSPRVTASAPRGTAPVSLLSLRQLPKLRCQSGRLITALAGNPASARRRLLYVLSQQPRSPVEASLHPRLVASLSMHLKPHAS